MDIGRIADAELDEVATWIATQQADPTRHIAYESMEADAVASDLRQLEPHGLDDVLVATEGDDVVGLLGLEHDTEPPRVWWRGPFVADGVDVDAVAEALLAAGRARLPAHVTQEEFAPDDRHAWLPAFAARHGFVAEEASAVLVRDLPGEAGVPRPQAVPPDDLQVAGVDATTAPAVGALHDAIFPGTHASGSRIAAPGEGHAVFVAVRAGEVVGYVAVERQEDGSGYVDYLGVVDRERGRGIGRTLVAAGCVWLHDEAGCPSAHLTVRESNRGARRLYESLGFDEERLIRPWRRGFSLAHLDTPPPA